VIEALVAALSDGERRCFLAARGALDLTADADAVNRMVRQIAAFPDELLRHLARDDGALRRVWPRVGDGRFPGRAAALLAAARALGRPLPDSEYALPEHALDALLAQARRSLGARVPLAGARGHKGRVGDGVERLLLGGKAAGRASDHPAAEIKSVPVQGGRVIERVKLGVINARADPLDKCARVLFVFVEQRGADHFVRGHALVEFDRTRWAALWRDGFLVETAAGSTERPARGLYLVPRWFRASGLWPR
jgi:hypothetical protein